MKETSSGPERTNVGSRQLNSMEVQLFIELKQCDPHPVIEWIDIFGSGSSCVPKKKKMLFTAVLLFRQLTMAALMVRDNLSFRHLLRF